MPEAIKATSASGRSLAKGHPSATVMTHYWGCHQRFFRQLCMAIKIDRTVELAKTALAENKCVVIGLQSTGESRLNDAVSSEEDLDEFCGMREVRVRVRARVRARVRVGVRVRVRVGVKVGVPPPAPGDAPGYGSGSGEGSG